jgi:hypothetical protein
MPLNMANSSAIRQRRYRDRQRGGRVVLTVEVDEVALSEALLAAGFISPEHADDRQALETALEYVVHLWVTRNGAGFSDVP